MQKLLDRLADTPQPQEKPRQPAPVLPEQPADQPVIQGEPSQSRWLSGLPQYGIWAALAVIVALLIRRPKATTASPTSTRQIADRIAKAAEDEETQAKKMQAVQAAVDQNLGSS